MNDDFKEQSLESFRLWKQKMNDTDMPSSDKNVQGSDTTEAEKSNTAD